MKKTIIYRLLIFFISIFQVIAQESVPGDSYPEFSCTEFRTTCGRNAVACGFSERERVQDAAHWENFYCGNP
ncbi:hypothetical protein SAMN04488519_10975 [Algoriphagus ornithinivorans]|uniref:Uncharacterized protein n=1 Tax=Algoriphagus ornithinivorans TaxID=226506 RepID=A0A1I5IME1_9BACT|nr:hypothetical protein [Algoriphagus ornithinivorans]SFO61643.1 hypothetical protein SAMN04488519_10975 [Algoriphagus ornithinivorans]